jgi:hypothetical protein
MQISPLSAQWTVATFSKARRSSAMADREVTSIERLARQMCKLLLHEMSLLAAVLRDRLSEQAQHERHRISGAWRRKSGAKPGDFDKALALGVANGWLSHDDQAVRITTEGAALARRSRAGRRRSRRVI